MRRAAIMAAMAAGLVVTLGLADAPRRSVQAPSEMAELREEVAQLRRRVGELEQRLEERAVVPIPRDLLAPNTRTPDPLDRLRRGRVPENWRPYEFNGIRYYVIPCRTARARPAKRTK